MKKSLVFFFIFLGTFTLNAREYYISNVDIELRLQADGSIHVTESRSFTFEGSYSEVYRSFPKSDDVHFSQFQVYENGKQLPLTEKKQEGSMRIIDRRRETEIQVFFDARDTVRTFMISFIVEGAVERYDDVAVLYYQAVSTDWEVPNQNVRVTVFPAEYPGEFKLMQWWHGSLDIFSQINNGGVIVAEVAHLDASDIMEVRALYPTDMFTGLQPIEGTVADEIIQQETAWAEEANLQRERRREREIRQQERYALGKKIVIPIALAYIMLWVWLYMRYGGKPKTTQQAEGFSGLPSKEKPAFVNFLLNGTYTGVEALVATIFHLASRGFLTIVEQEHQGKRKDPKVDFVLKRQKWEQQKETLEGFENMLLDFLFNDLAKGSDELSNELLKKKTTKMQSFLPGWKKQIKDEAEKFNWYDKQSERDRNKGLIISLLAMALVIPLIIFFGPFMLILMVLVFASLIVSLMFFKRTDKGEAEFQKWKFIKAYLKKASFGPESANSPDENIGDYLIYGIALGLDNKFVDRLTSTIEPSTYNVFLWWLVIHPSRVNTLGKTVNGIVTTTNSAFTTSTGGGGTMGGGGGVSSGGGGAR